MLWLQQPRQKQCCGSGTLLDPPRLLLLLDESGAGVDHPPVTPE
jgi:hypothetical protein